MCSWSTQAETRSTCCVMPTAMGKPRVASPFASGLRNPVGLAFNPVTNELWTAVNERDGLGDDLVPDYFTSVKEGGFYGWPYSYIGANLDPRMNGKGKDLAATALIPDVLFQAHSASLGAVFYTGAMFPAE